MTGARDSVTVTRADIALAEEVTSAAGGHYLVDIYAGAEAIARHREAAQAELVELSKANLGTFEEQRRRCARWGKSHFELDRAIEETRSTLSKINGGEA